MKPNYRIAGLLAFIVAWAWPVSAEQTAIISSSDIHHPVYAKHGMVASQEAVATRIGVDILARGGNAVDAAVAVGFALAVTLPRAGNIGGGGFMLVHDAARGETVAIDYREQAPKRAHRDMYLDQTGAVVKARSRFSHLATGVPGTVAGFALALERYGSLDLATVMAPAIKLAANGFVVSQDLARSLTSRAERLRKNAEARRIFFRPDGTAYETGDWLVQADLGRSLRLIAEQGPAAFYQGDIANKIVAEMAAHGGFITAEDLAGYRAIVRQPVRGRYRGYEIASMPPPSSGGVHLVQLLNILEGFPLAELGHNSAAGIHLMTEAMKRAYADRAVYLGDPDFVSVPVAGLTSKAYAAGLREKIDRDHAALSSDIAAGPAPAYESRETTHYSVMDRFGNVVSNTYTINFSFGSGIVAAGTGVFLNNEMDDFSAKSGVPNAYGLIGGEANAVGPGKRPLSSMTPTILFKDGKPVVATGSPGGSRIITTVLQTIVNWADHGLNVAAAASGPRFHHQWLPDTLFVEQRFSPDTLALLKAKGHQVKETRAMGSTQTVQRIDDGFLGASDPRRQGALTAGY